MSATSGKVEVYHVKNTETLKDIIFLLDSYRVHHYEELYWADRVIKAGEMGYKFRKDWKNIRKILTSMAEVPKSLTYLFKLAKVQMLFRFIGLALSSVTMIIIGLSFFFYWGRHPTGMAWIMSFLRYLGIPLVIGFVLSFAGPPLIARKIHRELDEYRDAHSEKFERYNRILRKTVQRLICSLIECVRTRSSEIKEEKPLDLLVSMDEAYRGFLRWILRRPKREKIVEHEFELFNLDYVGVKVIKKAGFLRKYCIVAPNISESRTTDAL